MQFLLPFFIALARLVVVLGINLSIFLLIPLSQELFKTVTGGEIKEPPQHRLVAEIIRKQDEPKKKDAPSRIRTVEAGAGRSLSGRMDFKLSPDLTAAGPGDGVAIGSGEIGAEVFDEGEVDNQAIPVYFPQPAFPKEARELAIEGDVKVVFIVNPDGLVGNIEEVSAPHPSFEREIRKAFLNWKFKPAINNGIPVQSRKSIVIEFSLES